MGGGGFFAMSPIFFWDMNYFLVWVIAKKLNIQVEGYFCEWDGIEVDHAFVCFTVYCLIHGRRCSDRYSVWGYS